MGLVSLIDWKHVDEGLKKAVEDSPCPFDPTIDVLVFYEGSNGVYFMFVVELEYYNKHFLDQEVTFQHFRGYIVVTKQGIRSVGLHRLVLGLEKGDGKTGRHRVDGIDGKRDNRLRVLRQGNHRNNGGDRDQKTSTSTSIHQGVCWVKQS